jgi:hypothetical protein
VTRSRIAALPAFALTAVLLAGCGGEKDASLPACAQPPASIDRPAILPAWFPFPDGTVFTRSFRNRSTHGVPAAAGLLPLKLNEAVSYFDRELPRAGVEVTVRLGEPSGSEAFYETKGFSGRYAVRELRACGRATRFVVTARPTLLGRGFSE